MNTKAWIEQLRKNVSGRLPVVVAGVGSGLTAKGAVAGGADVLAVYNTAVYRVLGLPTALAFLPYDDANALTFETAPQVLAQAGSTPVVLGLGAHDPRQPIEQMLDRVQALGAAGVTNEPFIGLYSDEIQAQLSAAGLGFAREVALIRAAADRGLLTLGWAFTPDEARTMAEAGATIVGAMIGVTAGGSAGGTALTPLDEAVEKVRGMVQAAKAVRLDCLVLGHGGSLNDAASVAVALERTGMDGYVTGSTGERVPVEKAVAEAIRGFKETGRSLL
ncbi:MAG: phosphoenolpyruvate hydrolase family protein [Anaerolineae bacterium]|nr:phosphoenolpyruvate hydrolase family protein [Anaerolineae bacterium]